MSDVTLTDFLLARIAEDEDFAREHVDASHLWWLPERVLAECEAKRRIVEEHWLLIDVREEDYCATCVSDLGEQRHAPWPCLTLRALAAPFADHPDYREEWAKEVRIPMPAGWNLPALPDSMEYLHIAVPVSSELLDHDDPAAAELIGQTADAAARRAVEERRR